MPTDSSALIRTGQGHPLVLIHGFGLDSAIWAPVIAPLAKRYEVIVVGLPGLGHPTFTSIESMEGLAHWLHQQLSPLQLPPLVMAGHSMGGYAALSYLEQFPSRLQGLCLVHSHVFADTKAKQAERTKVIEFVRKNGTEAWAKAAIPPLFSQSYQRQAPQEILQWIRRYSHFEPEVVAHYLVAMANRKDHQATLQKAQQFIGFIMGQHDQHAPIDKNLAQATLPNKADLYLLGKSAHMGMQEEPEKMIQALDGFMQTCFRPIRLQR